MMEKPCRSSKQPVSGDCKVCPHCGAHLKLGGRIAEALKWAGGIATVVSLILGVNSLVGLYQGQLEKREAVAELAAAANQLRLDSDFERSWQLYDQAQKLEPGSRLVRRGQERLVIDWLPNVHITGDETFTAIVNKTLPVLMRALVRTKGSKAADIQALIGWAHALEQRERGVIDTDVPDLYSRALELDPENAYANAFLGHWLLSEKKDLLDGTRHFAVALKSGRHREFVRNYQWGGLLNYLRRTSTGSADHIAARKEQLKMLSQMLANGEPWLKGSARSMPREAIEAYGNPYRQSEDWFDQVWPVLAPEEHIKLVSTMVKEVEQVDFLSLAARFLLGRIYEKQGNNEQSLSYFRVLDQQVTSNNMLRVPLDAALQRLTGEITEHAAMRENPLQFYDQVLKTADLQSDEYQRALDYFSGLTAEIASRNQLEKVEPAIEILGTAYDRITAALKTTGGKDSTQTELISRYYVLSDQLGSLLLYSRKLDRSVDVFGTLAGDKRLSNWQRLEANYNLACSLSLRSEQKQDADGRKADRDAAVQSLIESISFGYDDWDHIKRDADLEPIRRNPEYIRVMSGR